MKAHRKYHRLNGLIVATAIAAAIFFTACKDDDNEPVPAVPTAYVALYQASPNAPSLDIMVDDRTINNYPFRYTDYTGYLRFYTGSRNLKFGPYNASNVVVDTTVTFQADHAYSVFLVDEYNDADVLVLEDNVAAIPEGKARLRFLNLSPDSRSFKLIVNGTSTALFTDQAFKAKSEFKEIDAAQYDLQVKNSDGETVLLNLPSVKLQSGWQYTILVRGYSAPPSGNSNTLSAQVIVN